MKALSLWQPWASLVVLGLKQYETRSWKTAYRGTLVIHAAKTWNDDLLIDWNRFQLNAGRRFDVPRGVALGTVDLIDICPVEILLTQLGFRYSDEFYFGNYSPGRYAWKLANPILFAEPIPCAGHQRLWEVS